MALSSLISRIVGACRTRRLFIRIHRELATVYVLVVRITSSYSVLFEGPEVYDLLITEKDEGAPPPTSLLHLQLLFALFSRPPRLFLFPSPLDPEPART